MLAMDGFVISALFPLVAIGASFGAIAAAWRHRRGLMALLIVAATLASAGTLYLLWWFYTH